MCVSSYYASQMQATSTSKIYHNFISSINLCKLNNFIYVYDYRNKNILRKIVTIHDRAYFACCIAVTKKTNRVFGKKKIGNETHGGCGCRSVCPITASDRHNTHNYTDVTQCTLYRSNSLPRATLPKPTERRTLHRLPLQSFGFSRHRYVVEYGPIFSSVFEFKQKEYNTRKNKSSCQTTISQKPKPCRNCAISPIVCASIRSHRLKHRNQGKFNNIQITIQFFPNLTMSTTEK